MIFVYVMVIIMIILNNIIQIFWQGLAADFFIIFFADLSADAQSEALLLQLGELGIVSCHHCL